MELDYVGYSHELLYLRAAVQKLKDATLAGVFLGSGKLATELDLIDEYKFLVHRRIAGHGPTLYQSGLPRTRRLNLGSARPLLPDSRCRLSDR